MQNALYFFTHESQVTGILMAQKMQDKDLTKKCLHTGYNLMENPIQQYMSHESHIDRF